MALNQMGLGFVFTARDQASATIQRVSGTFNREANRVRMSSDAMQGAMVGVGASVATMAAGVGTLRGAFSIAREAGQMEQGLARVQAVTQATGEELGQLRNRAIQAGIETQFSPQEAVQGLGELGQRGFQASESMAALGGVLDFAAGGQISVAQGAQTVGAALRVFGLEAGDATMAADRLLRISNLSSLQSNELALALGNVSRGAGLTTQNMDSMLVAMGLVRNTGVEASVAASSVSSALLQMSKNAEEIESSLGVSVTETLADGSTQFREFNEVILEAAAAAGERFPDQAERAAHFMRLFGRFGLTSANAIGQQLANGVRNAEGEIVRGAEALEFMLNTMRNADGTAEQFRETLLDTFEGQLTLLQGTVQTLRVVLGEVFTVAIRPFVEALTNTLNFFIRVVNAIPAPIKNVIGQVIIGIGVLLTAFGGLGAIGFAVALIIPFLKAIAVTMGIIVAATLPVIAAIAAVGAAVAAFALAWRRNLGGIATFGERIWGQIRLGYNALVELFTRGGFSKAVSEELRQTENRGLRRFVINIFGLWARLRRVWTGIREGFTVAFRAIGPAITSLRREFGRLWRQISPVSDVIDETSRGPMERFRLIGMRIGKFVGSALVRIVDVIRQVVQFTNGLIAQWKQWQPNAERIWNVVAAVIRDFGAAVSEAFGMADAAAQGGRNGQSAAEDMGRTFTDIVVPALLFSMIVFSSFLDILTFVIRGVNGFVKDLRRGFQAVDTFINHQMSNWRQFKALVLEVVDIIAASMLRVMRLIPEPVRQRLGLGGVEATLDASRERNLARGVGRVAKAQRVAAAQAAGPATAAQPAVAQAAGAAGAARPASEGEALAALRATLGAIQATVNAPINVQVDGETIARATRAGARSASAGEFAPVGIGE